jgi:hypothetical protein
LLAQPDATMQVYPNPVNDLYDVSGKTLALKNYSSMSGMMNIDLNTSTLQSGVYIVELIVDNDKLVKRLVVE